MSSRPGTRASSSATSTGTRGIRATCCSRAAATSPQWQPQNDTFRQEVMGLEPAAQLASRSAPGGLRSAYKAFHGSEPRFTNYARNRDNPPFCETLDYISRSATWH
ncbi:unnamed protein product [Prorocentrum cordatum]|uniref:Uncharacterized protein n=1 Tax=Prorocentrum cordatum TaxID=2364126 RepID=A0ABN9QUV8_9DINO|nr:unnamed protein product [Polarella glacialis]